MQIVTHEGWYLSGSAEELVAQLPTLLPVPAGRSAGLFRAECARIPRYRREIGPAFACYAAESLLRNLEEEGLLLIRP